MSMINDPDFFLDEIMDALGAGEDNPANVEWMSRRFWRLANLSMTRIGMTTAGGVSPPQHSYTSGLARVSNEMEGLAVPVETMFLNPFLCILENTGGHAITVSVDVAGPPGQSFVADPGETIEIDNIKPEEGLVLACEGKTKAAFWMFGVGI